MTSSQGFQLYFPFSETGWAFSRHSKSGAHRACVISYPFYNVTGRFTGKQQAYQPYAAGTITQEEAFSAAMKPMRTFMLKQTNKQEMKLFLSLSGEKSVKDYDDIPTSTLIPAFVLSELKRAFIMGFLILIPS
jgi:flagellar biosynthesis protein FliP